MLLDELIDRMDDGLIPRIVELASIYDHRIQLGNKPIFHLEGFVANCMAE